mgnify:CR=1 FL=1
MKELSKEVREIMKEYIGDNSVAGVTVLAVQDGKEICDCQEGMADIDGNFQNVIPGTGQEHIVPAGINDMDLAFPLDFIRKECESRSPFCRMALTDILDVLFKEER